MQRLSRPAPLLLSMWILACSAAWAEVEFTPSLGMRFGGSVETDLGDDTIDPSASFGLTFDLSLAPEKWIAVLWSHQRAEVETTGLFPDDDSFEMDVDYFHAGGVYRPGLDKKTQGFVMVTVGLTWVRPQMGGFGDEFGLSGMVGGGAKIVLSPRVGLRFEGRGYLTFTSMTFSGVCGGVGCSLSFSGGGIFQFEALGGVTFAF